MGIRPPWPLDVMRIRNEHRVRVLHLLLLHMGRVDTMPGQGERFGRAEGRRHLDCKTNVVRLHLPRGRPAWPSKRRPRSRRLPRPYTRGPILDTKPKRMFAARRRGGVAVCADLATRDGDQQPSKPLQTPHFPSKGSVYLRRVIERGLAPSVEGVVAVSAWPGRPSGPRGGVGNAKRDRG